SNATVDVVVARSRATSGTTGSITRIESAPAKTPSARTRRRGIGSVEDLTNGCLQRLAAAAADNKNRSNGKPDGSDRRARMLHLHRRPGMRNVQWPPAVGGHRRLRHRR